MTLDEFVRTLNEWGAGGVPFLFIIDFEMRKPMAWTLDSVSPETVLFSFNGKSNTPDRSPSRRSNRIGIVGRTPIDASEYNRKFRKVMSHLAYGDSFLTNLTIETSVDLSGNLRDLYFACEAKYKLWYNDSFLVFSPETFVRIENGIISTFPMKGTIDATVENARQKILTDQKELAEHITIVDLLRNDLSQVANDVTVQRFRFIETLRTNHKTLLQVSSEITGKLPVDYQRQLGTLLVTVLPAGSVSGAPKPKTLEVIRMAEEAERGYYTGVMGYFDGSRLESGVMIRFVERKQHGFVYRSGGGITTQSTAASEYQEAIDKVYVPID